MEIDAECEAGWILKSIGLDPDEVASPKRIAEAYTGRAVVELPAVEVWGSGEAEWLGDGEFQILIRSGLDPIERAWTLCHETSEVHLKKIGYRVDDFREKEAAANAIAARLLMPRRRFLRALRDEGENFAALAHAFRVSETAAALRTGESRDIPLAVVGGPTLYVRGPEWGWPSSAEEMRRIARLPAFPGVRHSRLGDDPRRVVLIGLEAA